MSGGASQSGVGRGFRSGKLGLDDLKRVELAVLAEIATVSLSVGAGATSGGLAGGLLSLACAVGGLFGLPGRATGGNVTGGSAYMVGERGPEIFVPTSSGRVETMGGTRDRQSGV